MWSRKTMEMKVFSLALHLCRCSCLHLGFSDKLVRNLALKLLNFIKIVTLRVYFLAQVALIRCYFYLFMKNLKLCEISLPCLRLFDDFPLWNMNYDECE